MTRTQNCSACGYGYPKIQCKYIRDALDKTNDSNLDEDEKKTRMSETGK